MRDRAKERYTAIELLKYRLANPEPWDNEPARARVRRIIAYLEAGGRIGHGIGAMAARHIRECCFPDCGGKALYRVGFEGYCKHHKFAAVNRRTEFGQELQRRADIKMGRDHETVSETKRTLGADVGRRDRERKRRGHAGRILR